MPFFLTGAPTLLSSTLTDHVETKYLKAFVWANGTQETTLALAHVGLGRYTGIWVPATNSKYNVIFRVYDDAPRTILSQGYEQQEETWQSLDGAVGPAVADSVWDEQIAGHAAPGSAGEHLARTALIEKILRNRLELAEGDSNNWVLYDDDSVTPLLTWSVTDRDGGTVRMNPYVPARRTRGT